MSPPHASLHGLLVVDKPGLPADPEPGTSYDLPTSHDVVQRVRRWSGQRRIGHAGTLDPFASGVLVLCLGVATRLAEYYTGHDKVYRAHVRLGTATETYDPLGRVVETCPLPELDEARIRSVLAGFLGPQEQVPPAFSAIRQGGERLYHKARRGETVQVKPRRITVHRLELLELLPPDRLHIRVHCSAGTYVRSLAHDLGRALDSCAHLSYLRREAAGPFQVGQAHTLDTIREAAQAGRLPELLLPLGTGLHLPRLELDPETARRLGQGQRVPIEAAALLDPVRPRRRDRLQGLDLQGRLRGILQVLDVRDDGTLLCKAEKWLVYPGTQATP